MNSILCGGLLAALVATPGAALEVVLQEGRGGYSGTDDSLLHAPGSVAEINYGVAPSAGASPKRLRGW